MKLWDRIRPHVHVFSAADTVVVFCGFFFISNGKKLQVQFVFTKSQESHITKAL